MFCRLFAKKGVKQEHVRKIGPEMHNSYTQEITANNGWADNSVRNAKSYKLCNAGIMNRGTAEI